MENIKQINTEFARLQKDLENKNSEVEYLANKLATQTKEINQFTYIISHDLQAPLRMVTGFMDLLEKKYGDKLDETAKQYIDFAVKGAMKMKNLVFDLLEYSRLNTVIQPHTEIDLNNIVAEVKEKLSSAVQITGALITTDPLPVVMASKTQMEQLFQHLISNALKFRSMAVPEINITLKKQSDLWIIAVKDNGIGIEPAFFEKIFTVFRQLHNDEAKYNGTGIGLAVCKKIAELHGGTIWVESEPGKGSTFFFTLPVQP